MPRTEAVRDRTGRAAPSRVTHVVGLVVAAAGVMIEYLTGVPGFPAVPPGPIILLVVAAIVAQLAGRATVVLGLVAAAFLSVGAVAAGTTGEVLAAPEVIGQFLGALVQVLGLVVALVAGVAALLPTRGGP